MVVAEARGTRARGRPRRGAEVVRAARWPGGEPAARRCTRRPSRRWSTPASATTRPERRWSVRPRSTQFQLARETALEGLAYVRAARVSLGFDPGPPLPPLASQRGAGAIRQEREVTVGDRELPGLATAGRHHALLLPGRSGLRSPGAGRVVFRALVEDRPGRGRVGDRRCPRLRRVAGAELRRLRQATGRAMTRGSRPATDQGYDQGFDQGQQTGLRRGAAAGSEPGSEWVRPERRRSGWL